MGKKILIIDDNKQDRMIIRRFLHKMGCEEVAEAESGEEGIKKVESENPDLVIVDTILPGMDGFGVCRSIKEAKTPHIPKVIIITGTVDAVDAVKARKMGADDYCVKTSDGTPLMGAVNKLI